MSSKANKSRFIYYAHSFRLAQFVLLNKHRIIGTTNEQLLVEILVRSVEWAICLRIKTADTNGIGY